jgi:hypothetical protein
MSDVKQGTTGRSEYFNLLERLLGLRRQVSLSRSFSSVIRGRDKARHCGCFCSTQYLRCLFVRWGD